MGLDLVELVMAVEAKFSVDIPGEAASRMETPRDIVDFVMATRPSDDRRAVESALMKLIEAETGVDTRSFTLDSRFVRDMGLD